MIGTRKRSSPPLFDNNNSNSNSNSNSNNNNNFISPPSPLSPKQTNQFLFNNGLDNYNNSSSFTVYQPQTTTSFINNRLNQFSLVSDSEQLQQQQQASSSSPTSPTLLPPLKQQIYQYIDENDSSNLNSNSNNFKNNNIVTNKSNIKKNNNRKVKRHINFKLDDEAQQNDNEREDEFYETNTDFGYLSVSTKEDLLVCLNVLKKEMGQFKNLSQNLLSRLQLLEKGIGQEKQIRLNGHSRNNSDQDSFESNYIINTSSLNNSSNSSNNSNGRVSSPNLLSSNSNNNNNSNINGTAIIQQEILISTCLLEIQKIIEKQRTYDGLLAQREKYWDIELNKLTMQILNKLNNGQHPNDSQLSHHLHHNHHLLNSSPNSTELQTFHHDQELYFNNSFNINNNGDEIFDSYTALNNINNSIIRNNSSSNLSESNNSNSTQIINSQNQSFKNRFLNSFKRVYIYLFGTKKTITFWKKVLIISIIVILWPLIANLIYKLVMYIINKKRLSNQSKQLINNSSNNSNNISKLSSTLKPLKSTSLNNTINSASSITNSASSSSNNISSLISNSNNSSNSNSQTAQNNVFKKIKSSILSNKKGGDLLNSNSNTNQIRAPDIVKAFIQGVSTGDGGSNNNLTNNTLTSLTNTLGNLNPNLSSISSNSNSSGSTSSVVNNTSNLISNSLNSLTSSSSSTPSTSTSLASIIPNSSNIDNNTTSNVIRNGFNRVRSLNNNNNNSYSHNDGPEGNMLKMVRNLLGQR